MYGFKFFVLKTETATHRTAPKQFMQACFEGFSDRLRCSSYQANLRWIVNKRLLKKPNQRLK